MELELDNFFIGFGFDVRRKLVDGTVMDAVGTTSNTAKKKKKQDIILLLL